MPVALDDFVFRGGWDDLRGRTVDDEEERLRLEEELGREVEPGHVLHGVKAEAVAACRHCDDVLFALAGGRYAVVHLSLPAAVPDRPPRPATALYPGWEPVVAYLADHQDG